MVTECPLCAQLCAGFGDYVVTSLPLFLEKSPEPLQICLLVSPLSQPIVQEAAACGFVTIFREKGQLIPKYFDASLAKFNMQKIYLFICSFVFGTFPERLHTIPHLGVSLRLLFLLPLYLTLLWFQSKFQRTGNSNISSTIT